MEGALSPEGLGPSCGISALSDRAFNQFVTLARSHAGIALGATKRAMVAARLRKVMHRYGMVSFDDYAERLRDASPRDIEEFVDAIATNLTAFFRESHHFEYLRETALPALKVRRADSRRLRLWSAGCSSGEEAYTLALILHEAIGTESWDARILATDIDHTVVERASLAIYDEDRLQEVPERYRRIGFQRGTGAHAGHVRVRPEVAARVTVRQLNLIGAWPMRGPYDVIFCRNVTIYFDKATQRALFDRFANLLTPDGLLFIGHSENLFQITERFDPLGRTIYRKVA